MPPVEIKIDQKYQNLPNSHPFTRMDKLILVHKNDSNSINILKLDFTYQVKNLLFINDGKLDFNKPQPPTIELIPAHPRFIMQADENSQIKALKTINSIFNEELKKKLGIIELAGLFKGIMDESEQITFCISGNLKDTKLYYVLGTSSGKIILVPFFVPTNEKTFDLYYS
jgi:hypothetical protein